ncbi:MAG: ABC transporter substrate-binding protein [Candidatus Hydrogenedentes bacterium]|nr:ABC transporter substrate-binding protein [Candidatus Hydrogenedentota bacterium]
MFVGTAAILAGLYSLTGAPPMPSAGKTIITFWQPWPGDQGEELRRLIDLFNRTHPAIQVRTLYVPHNPASNQKLFLSISAGIPPDCTIVGGPQVCEWAARGALESLDALMAKHGVHNDDFWPPCARQCQFRGKTFGLTYCADPNFALFWNRTVFREAGLLEGGPPRTLEDLDRLSRQLTQRDANGRLTRIGFIPWSVFGFPNSIFTWGWAFGGEFYDDRRERLTCGEDPHVLEALRWMKSYADEYGFEAINSFSEGFGDEADSPFLRGKIAMAAGHISNLRFFAKYAPDLDYGVAPFPYPEKMGSDQSAWIGGWCVRGSHHPEAAFEFMKWLCSSPEMGKSMVQSTGHFPGYRYSSALELVKGDEKMTMFFDILRTAAHQRPVMPAEGYFMGVLDHAVSDVLNGLKTPEQALEDAQADAQKELDRVLARLEK